MSGLKISNFFGKKLKETKDSLIQPLPESVLKYDIPYWLTVALTQVGTTEIPGPESNSKIDGYLKTVGMPSDDDIAWCSGFACWCLEEAGFKSTRKPNAQSFLHSRNFIKLDEPRLGCIVVLKRGTEPWMGHVGFWLDMYRRYIRLLGGNQANRVGINNYKEDTVMGYFWPKAA